MRRHRRREPCGAPARALVLMVGLLCHAAWAQEQFPSELKTVDRLRLEGRHQVSAREIRAAMKTRAGSILPWRERPTLRLDFLRADTLGIATVYRQHGFLDVRVEYRIRSTRDPRRAVVTFVIHEGERARVKAVELSGARSYPEPQLRKKLHARPGRAFNPAYLIADTSRISEAYQERGFRPHMTASAVRESLDVTVHYDVNEGPVYHFGQVYLSSPGEVHVQDRLIRRELLVTPGALYRRSRVTRSLERLYETGLFSQIQITALPDSTNSLIELDMRVRERKPRWIDASVGSGTYERFSLHGEWGHRNLAGQGLQGTLASRLSFDGNAKFLLTRTEASLLEPWLFRSRTRGQVKLYYEKHDDRASNPLWVVHQEAPGLTFEARREFGRYVRLALAQDNAFVKQHITFDPSVPDSDVQKQLQNVAPSYTTHRLTLALDRDLRDDPLNAARGSVQNLTAEIAGGPLKGNSSYSKGQINTASYTPLPNGWVIATRVRAGLIGPFGARFQFSPADSATDEKVARVPLENRFRLGGVNSLRGFDENSVPRSGGLALLQANAELRIPVAGPFGLEFYLDAGNVWARPSYIKGKHLVPRSGHTRPDPGDVQYVFGGGGRLNLPFGPLRLDFTWSPRPVDPLTGRWLVHELQFAIGPSF